MYAIPPCWISHKKHQHRQSWITHAVKDTWGSVEKLDAVWCGDALSRVAWRTVGQRELQWPRESRAEWLPPLLSPSILNLLASHRGPAAFLWVPRPARWSATVVQRPPGGADLSLCVSAFRWIFWTILLFNLVVAYVAIFLIFAKICIEFLFWLKIYI